MSGIARKLRNVTALVGACVLAATTIAACSNKSSSNNSAGTVNTNYTLRMGDDGAAPAAGVPLESQPQAAAEQYFVDAVSKATNGHVTIKLYRTNVLGTPQAQLTQLEAGTLDMVDLSPTNLTGQIPAFGLLSLPCLMQSLDEVSKLLGSSVMKTLYDNVSKQYDITPGIAWATTGAFQLVGSKPIANASSLHGVRVRTTTDPIMTAFFQSLGASVSPLPPTQMYSALQQHVIDQNLITPTGLLGFKLYEVAHYLSQTVLGWNVELFMTSNKALAKLPAQYRDAITQAATQTTTYALGIENTAITKNADTVAGEPGMHVTNADTASFVTAATPIWTQFSAKIGGTYVQDARTLLGK